MGLKAYMVGGAIRDLLIKPNVIPKDLDIATSAMPVDIKQLFANSKFVGETFGVSLVQHNDIPFEITTFRKEGEYADEEDLLLSQKGTFQEDANRRDFL